MPKVYLDSCVVIYLIQGPESLSQAVRDDLGPNEEDLLTICVSDLTRLECRVWPIRHGDEGLLGQFDDFFASEELEKTTLQTDVFDLATELRARHGTKTPDALHLAAAMLLGCQEFWTNDHRLKAAAESRIILKVFS